MVRKKIYSVLPTEMKILHDDILDRQKMGILRLDEDRLVFMVQVPPGLNLAEFFPMEKLYLDCEDMFKMFNFFMLSPSSIRLWAIYQANQVTLQKVQDLVVADPYLMNEDNLGNPKGLATAKQYLSNFMVGNKEKDHLLVLHRFVKVCSIPIVLAFHSCMYQC